MVLTFSILGYEIVFNLCSMPTKSDSTHSMVELQQNVYLFKGISSAHNHNQFHINFVCVRAKYCLNMKIGALFV